MSTKLENFSIDLVVPPENRSADLYLKKTETLLGDSEF